MTIRKMLAEDARAVYEISSQNFSESWSLESIEKEADNPVASYFVAEENEVVVGYGGLWHVLDEGEIINIAVLKNYQNQGIGKQIFSKLMEEAKKRNLVVIHLEVRASNEVAKKLYEQAGFNVIATRKGYYHEPVEDALIMENRLN